MRNLKMRFAALILCFAMVFTNAGSMSAMALINEDAYAPLYWVDGDDNYDDNYINGIDTPFEQVSDNGGRRMKLYYQNDSSQYIAIDETTFANVQKSGGDIGFFGWVDPGKNSLFWNTEDTVPGEEGQAVFTVGDVSYCIKLKVVAPNPAEKAAEFIQEYVNMGTDSPMLKHVDAIFDWEDLNDDVKAAVNAQLTPIKFAELAKAFVQSEYNEASDFAQFINGNTINIGNAGDIREGGIVYQYLTDEVKNAVDVSVDTNFASLKADQTTLSFADIAAAADFIYEHLLARFADSPYMITKVNGESSNDELYMVRNGEEDWGTLSVLQKAVVNKALANEVADAMTYEDMLSYAKENNGSDDDGDDGDYVLDGIPYDISKVKELSVDEVVAIMQDDNGDFNFTKSNPNLDSIEKIWLLYKGTYGYDNEDSIREELFNRYGNTKYGPKSDPLTVVDGFNRLSQVGWFIYGHLSAIDPAVYVWEAEVERCLNKNRGGMKTAGIRFVHDALLTKAEQKLLATYLKTSIHDGFQIAKKCLQESETAVEEFRMNCLTDYVTGEPITEENVMLEYEVNGDYVMEDHSDNPFNVIAGEAVFREVFSNEQREQIDELCGGKGEYHKLLRLAQAYLLTRFDSSLSVENALAVVTSKGVGESFVKLINDALIYDKPVKVKINAKVTNSLAETDKDTLDDTLETSEELENYNLENYQDVTVKVFVDEDLIEDIHETNGEVTFEVGQAEEGKDYKLLRNHNGTVDVLDVEETEDGTLVAKSDKFSAYALVSTGGSNGGNGMSGAINTGSKGSGIKVRYMGGNSFSTTNSAIPTGVEIDGTPVSFTGNGSYFTVDCINAGAKHITVRWNSTSVTINFKPDAVVYCTEFAIPKTGDASFIGYALMAVITAAGVMFKK